MAKRSRRERRQEVEKRREQVIAPREESPSSSQEVIARPVTRTEASMPSVPGRKAVNFAQEYYYVYTELRNILIIAIFMFAVMVGLSFVI